MAAEPSSELERTEDGDLLAELDSVLCVDNTPYTGTVTFEDLAKDCGL